MTKPNLEGFIAFCRGFYGQSGYPIQDPDRCAMGTYAASLGYVPDGIAAYRNPETGDAWSPAEECWLVVDASGGVAKLAKATRYTYGDVVRRYEYIKGK